MLEARLNIEKEEQENFISHAKNLLIEDKLNEMKASREIARVVERKMSKVSTQALGLIESKSSQQAAVNQLKPQLIKNVLITTFMMVNNKLRRVK